MTLLVITMGEPSGIGGELTLKAWTARHEKNLPPFFVIDDPVRLRAIDKNIPIHEIAHPKEAIGVFDSALPILPLPLIASAVPGTLNPENGHVVLESIRLAAKFCLDGQATAMVTNPIHKAVLYEVGFNHPGHTEFIADLCGKNEIPVMMLVAKDLRVVPLTIHVPLKDVPALVTKDLICDRVRIVHKAMRQDLKILSPRIVVAGLNPHAGENGTIGLEDQEIILPAIQLLNSEGINVTGPHPADTLFHEEARKAYDAALGIYHDQALIPLKTLDFYGGVNMTLGLSVIRTSPDHGTALDIAGQGTARPDSLINAIKMAGEISVNRS